MASAKNHDAIPIPDAQVYARAVGKVGWTCPNCGQQYPIRNVPWRRNNLACERCHTKYQLGLGFSLAQLAPAYIMGKWNSYITNRLDPNGTPFDGCTLHGSIEWACPRCGTDQKAFLNAFNQLKCQSCPTDWYVALLFWRLPKVSRLKLRAPFDSLIPRKKNENQTIRPVPVAPSGESAGASGDSTRGVA